MDNLAKTSVIVCAFNEEKTVLNVIKDIKKNQSIHELIVVDDGSTDRTPAILEKNAEKYDFRFIKLTENKGKGFAMATGIEHSDGEIICFVDADLINFKPEFIDRLVEPLVEDQADIVLGQPENTVIPHHLNPFKSFTGERAVRKKEILPIVEKMKQERFGVETLINLYYTSTAKRSYVIKLEDLTHPTKFEKGSWHLASHAFMFEIGQIFKSLFRNRRYIIKYFWIK